MKRFTIVVVILLFSAFQGQAQSKSFEILKEQFKDAEDVHSFSIGGFFCRTVLWMVGEEDFRDAIKELNHLRMITIPKENFRERKLTLNGFRKVLQSDHFVSLGTVKEDGEHLEIFLQENGNNRKRYFVLVEDADEIIGIEMKGEIDLNKLSPQKEVLYYNL